MRKRRKGDDEKYGKKYDHLLLSFSLLCHTVLYLSSSYARSFIVFCSFLFCLRFGSSFVMGLLRCGHPMDLFVCVRFYVLHSNMSFSLLTFIFSFSQSYERIIDQVKSNVAALKVKIHFYLFCLDFLFFVFLLRSFLNLDVFFWPICLYFCFFVFALLCYCLHFM